MHRQFSRLLHSGLLVAALLPISPLATELTAAFSPALASVAQLHSVWTSPTTQVDRSGQDLPHLSQSIVPPLETADLGLPQSRSGGGTR